MHCASALRCVKYTTHQRKSAYATKALQVHAHAQGRRGAPRAGAACGPVGRRARGGSFLSLLPAPGREETITHSTPHTVLPYRLEIQNQNCGVHTFLYTKLSTYRGPLRFGTRAGSRGVRRGARPNAREARPDHEARPWRRDDSTAVRCPGPWLVASRRHRDSAAPQRRPCHPCRPCPCDERSRRPLPRRGQSRWLPPPPRRSARSAPSAIASGLSSRRRSTCRPAWESRHPPCPPPPPHQALGRLPPWPAGRLTGWAAGGAASRTAEQAAGGCLPPAGGKGGRGGGEGRKGGRG